MKKRKSTIISRMFEEAGEMELVEVKILKRVESRHSQQAQPCDSHLHVLVVPGRGVLERGIEPVLGTRGDQQGLAVAVRHAENQLGCLTCEI